MQDIIIINIKITPLTTYAYHFLIDLITASGRKGDASPPFLMISRTMVDATEVYFGSPVRKIVSMEGSIVLFASAIVFSYSKSDNITDATKNKPGTHLIAEINRKSFIYGSFNNGFITKYFFNPLHSLLGAKHRCFGRIDTNGNNDFVEQWYCTFNDIHVTKCYRVKCSREIGRYVA